MSLARAPIVYWRPPPFLEVGRIYRFGSSSTDTVVYRIAELGFNGWVRVEPPVGAQAAAAIWMNVDRLTVIEEIEEDVPQDTGTP